MALNKRGLEKRSAVPRGRPPSITLPQIVEGALRLGLDNLSLQQLADHLGVGLATLYRHIGSRDKLVRLASLELMLQRQFSADDADWAVIAHRYAETLLQALVAEPQLITELQRGRLGPHADIDVLDQFLTLLTCRGFSVEEGVRLFNSISMLLVGAATGQIGSRAAEEAGESWKLAARRALSERDDNELPLVRRAFPQFVEPSPELWQFALRSLLAGVAAARGERLPDELLPKSAKRPAESVKCERRTGS
jgi:AcrR family transcriptional regulator